MFKNIIKRDGSIEAFSPSKVNHWGEWAAQSLGDKVDWSSIVLHAVSTLSETATSQELQARLIKSCLDENTWSYNLMAGRLYAPLISKKVFGNTIPTIKELHTKLQEAGLMVTLNFTDEEYSYLNTIIDHTRDHNTPHYSLHHIREKYSLKNRNTGQEYETQQFVFMRMAMALATDQPQHRKMVDCVKWYNHFSMNRINAPTPNYTNLGTTMRGYASCCLYKADDNAKSLAIGDHIAYTMTYMSAGIGSHINTRSIGNKVRNGAINHQGRLPYYRSLVSAVKANLQNGRGGACTTFFSAFDPEAPTINMLQNPKSTEDKKIRGMDYAFMNNKFFARKVARNENIFTFNSFTAPDLYEAIFSSDKDLFETLYNQYDNDDSFKKNYVSARELLIQTMNQAYETGRHYVAWMDEINKHTPFKDPIYSSNLCVEIAEPTMAYSDMQDLYSSEDHGRGEIAICSLGSIVVANVKDEEYADTMYYCLLMIDKCIHLSEYAFPHLELTAKSRMNAGVGITGLAHYLAKNGFDYTSKESKEEQHRIGERHAYHAISQSLRLGKELGNAPWMHKTKWVDGWTPIDTYNRNVDGIVKPNYKYDWEQLSKDIIANKGIRNSCLVAHMPTESSSKASGTSNGLYPVRDLNMLKTDNHTVTYWSAPEGDTLKDNYQIAWNIPSEDLIETYAIFQKFTDQGISADLYRKIVGTDTVTSSEMISQYLYMTKLGLKSRYYQNTLTTDGQSLSTEMVGAVDCVGGACSL